MVIHHDEGGNSTVASGRTTGVGRGLGRRTAFIVRIFICSSFIFGFGGFASAFLARVNDLLMTKKEKKKKTGVGRKTIFFCVYECVYVFSFFSRLACEETNNF